MISNEVTITYIVHFNKTTESGRSSSPAYRVAERRAADNSSHARNKCQLGTRDIRIIQSPSHMPGAPHLLYEQHGVEDH